MLRSGQCGGKPYFSPFRASTRVVLDILVYPESPEYSKLLESRPWISYKVDRGAATAPITGPYPAPAAGPVDTFIGSLGRRVVFLSRRSINVDGAWFLDKMLALHYRKRGWGYIYGGVSSSIHSLSLHSLSLPSPSIPSANPNSFHWSALIHSKLPQGMPRVGLVWSNSAIQLDWSFTQPCLVLSLHHEHTRLSDGHEQMVIALPA